MAIPLSYNIRNLIVRKTTTVMTAVGIALTVAVLLAVLALVAGLRTAFASTGDPLHVLVLRKGGNAELSSIVTQQSFQIIKAFPGIAKGRDGQPLASLEVVSVINLLSPENPNGMNVTLRGLSPTGIELRHFNLMQGHWFTPGKREVVVGQRCCEYPCGRSRAAREACRQAETECRVTPSVPRNRIPSAIWMNAGCGVRSNWPGRPTSKVRFPLERCWFMMDKLLVKDSTSPLR